MIPEKLSEILNYSRRRKIEYVRCKWNEDAIDLSREIRFMLSWIWTWYETTLQK